MKEKYKEIIEDLEKNQYNIGLWSLKMTIETLKKVEELLDDEIL